MSFRELLDRIAELPRQVEGEHVPPSELVAFTVRTSRSMNGWKQSTLADFASVSLSTVERIERGEVVSTEALDKVAIALGHEAGYFTAPRRQKTTEEACRDFAERYGHLVPVPVAQVRTQAQVRALAKCHAMLFHSPDADDELMDLIKGFSEWLDLGSFLLSELLPPDRESEGRRREYYGDVLEHIERIRRQGYTVLGGRTTQPAYGIPDWRIAVLSITSRRTDPGAAKRKELLIDKRHWENTDIWSEDDA